VGTIHTMYEGGILLIVIALAKGMGKTLLQRKYLLVLPLEIPPNTVLFKVKLLNFSIVEFSTLMETTARPNFGEVFVQEIINAAKNIKVVDSFIFIFFLYDK
jgi:hypothetical protein